MRVRLRRAARRHVARPVAAIGQSLARASLGAGLRVAAAITAPLALSLSLAAPLLSWTSLGAFLVALGDPGGSDRARVRGTLAVTVAGSVAVGLATIAGASAVIAVLAMLLCAGAGALALRGDRALGLLGALATEAFIVSLAAPAAPGEALARALAFGAGGLWAAVLLVVVWPLRRTTPASLAMAHLVSALAAYTHALADAARHPRATRRWRRVTEDEPRRVRIRLLAATRLVAEEAQRSSDGAAERLTRLLETAEAAFALQLAVAEALDPASTTTEPPSVVAMLVEAEGRLHSIGAELRGARPRLNATGPASRSAWSASRTAPLAAKLCNVVDEAERVLGEHVVSAAELAVTGSHPLPRQPVSTPPRRRTARADLRARCDAWWGDPIVRHALRLGTLTAAVVACGASLGVERPQWVTLTILFSLQPHSGATRSATRGRVLGTAVGAVLVSLIGGATSPLWLCAGVFALAAAGVALLEVNYAAFCLFLTPLAVLLADPSAGASHTWHLAAVRLLDTCLGGALAIAGARLLWPEPTDVHLRALLADVTAATRDYLHAALIAGPSAASLEVAMSRRLVSTTSLAAEERLEIARQHDAGNAEVAALATLLERLRRLTLSITALTCQDLEAGHHSLADSADVGAAPDGWRAAVAGWFVLHRASEALRGGEFVEWPAPVPTVGDASSALRRLLEQLETVRAAAARAAPRMRRPCRAA